MSIKELTLQNGFSLPILKVLNTLNKECHLDEIISYLKENKIFTPKEGDLENIDFNGKVRLEYVAQTCIEVLIQQGLVAVSNNLFTITPSGLNLLTQEWHYYNQENFIKKVDSTGKNKYAYFNIPSSLLHNNRKQLIINGFKGHEGQYVKFLNDFVDYIDLNFPTIDEMSTFIKNTYSFENNNCLNAINILRSSGLVKVVAKNLTLTKLGQWYINSYNYIALFRIFAGRYIGFEEILNIVTLNKDITVEVLKEMLNKEYHFDWINTEQFDIRLNWLLDMNIFSISSSYISLSNEALDLAQYLGLIDIESNNIRPHIVPVLESTDDEIFDSVIEEFDEEDIDLSDELDNILDDIISESMSGELANDHLNFELTYSNEAIEQPSKIFDKHINISEQERNFLLNNLDIDNIFSEHLEEPQANDNKSENKDNNTDEFIEFKEILTNSKINGSSKEPNNIFNGYKNNIQGSIELGKEIINETASCNQINQSTVIHIPSKSSNNKTIGQTVSNYNDVAELYLQPKEISHLINLPNDITSKIVSALNMGKHLILTGPHGSGKTSIAVVLAQIAHQKNFNNGYNLTSANECWTSLDTIGNLLDIDNSTKKIFKEGFILKSVRENKWLIVDEITKCDTYKCFDDFINSLYGYNTILSCMHENYKNVEIICEPDNNPLEINQYVKDKNWRIIATMDTLEKNHMNFSSSFIRRFAFIDIGVNNYTSLIDEYFIKHDIQNDLLKTKIKSIFSDNGILKYKDVGTSSIHDLIQYISIRSALISPEESIQDILAEGLELFILPQLKILDENAIKEVHSYILNLFDGYDSIKKQISKAL